MPQNAFETLRVMSRTNVCGPQISAELGGTRSGKNRQVLQQRSVCNLWGLSERGTITFRILPPWQVWKLPVHGLKILQRADPPCYHSRKNLQRQLFYIYGPIFKLKEELSSQGQRKLSDQHFWSVYRKLSQTTCQARLGFPNVLEQPGGAIL